MKKLSLKIALTKPTCKCVYCYREFIKHTPHKCNGNFRKRHLKWIDYNNLN